MILGLNFLTVHTDTKCTHTHTLAFAQLTLSLYRKNRIRQHFGKVSLIFCHISLCINYPHGYFFYSCLYVIAAKFYNY